MDDPIVAIAVGILVTVVGGVILYYIFGGPRGQGQQEARSEREEDSGAQAPTPTTSPPPPGIAEMQEVRRVEGVARRVFISYSHDSEAHQDRVRGLADSLCRDGVDCLIDQYLADAPPEGWPLWMEREIERADIVLLVCTEAYYRWVRREEEPGRGLGVCWEAHIIYQHLYEARVITQKYRPVIFNETDVEYIPTPLRSTGRFLLDSRTGYVNLYRLITKQPLISRPPLGRTVELPGMPAAPRYDPPTPPIAAMPLREEQSRELRAVEICLDRDFDSFSQQDQASVLSAVGAMVGVAGSVRVLTRKRGSVILGLALTHGQADRLETLFQEGALTELGIISVRVASREETAVVLSRSNFLEAGIAPTLDFLGREREMEELHVRLQEGGVAIIHALIGEGGVGKTELAKAYALQHASDWDGRWWLDASEEAIEARTADLLAVVSGAEVDPGWTPDQIRLQLCRALSEGKHLLILDNLETRERLDGFHLREPSRVLVTTRCTDLPTAAVTPFEVKVLQRPAAIALLRKHREDLAVEECEGALGDVADSLGCHTLAVALAGEYLDRFPSVSPGELLVRLREAEVGAEGWVLDGIEADELGTKYRLNIAASLALHLPEFEGTPGMAILALAAHCHPDKIPVDLFFDAIDLPRPDVESGLRRLADRSIITYKETVGLHRLSQSAIRGRLGEPERRAALTPLVAVLIEHLKDPEDYRSWPVQDAYVPHAVAAVSHAEALGGMATASLLGNQVGGYFYERARFEAALGSLRRAERIGRTEFGDEHPNVAVQVNNIGSVLQAKGDLNGALGCLREAERIDRAAYGDDHPKVAKRVNNIGSVLKAKGDLDGALACSREAERIDRVAFGSDHPDVATDVNNIGSVLKANGDLDGALRCYQEAERIDRAAFGGDHPKVAIRVNNIGTVLQAKGDLDGALANYRDAERIDRAALGDDHPNVATEVNNIGTVLKIKGDTTGAAECFDEALRILLRTLGPRAGNTVALAENLIALGRDPLALAREIAGGEVAEELRQAMEEHVGSSEA